MLNLIYARIFQYAMAAAREGALEVMHPDGKRWFFGVRTADPVRVQICDKAFFKRIIRDGGIGLGESYTDGLWQAERLTDFLCFLAANKKYFDRRLKPFKGISHFVNAVLHRLRRNTLSNSIKNIQEHYDLSNDFFSLFLDPTMTYSCAVFENQTDSLETAQRNKIRRLAERIQISKEDHVLEIGCGWGAFAIQTVLATGCRWTGLTLSAEQKKWAEKKIAEAGLSEKITVKLLDYRLENGLYDKIISVEMIEAVGHEYLSEFFRVCARLLKSGGRMALQSIVIPQERYDHYRKNCDWLQKHIFPGGHLPSLELIETFTAAAGLKTGEIKRIGPDYAETLKRWHAVLVDKKSFLGEMGYNDAFFRKWRYYFSYCEAGFLTQMIDDVQVDFLKP